MPVVPISVQVASAPTWFVEAIEHPEMSLWVAVADVDADADADADQNGEVLWAVSLSERRFIDGRARRAGARVVERAGSQAAAQLRAYLAGDLRDFDLRIAMDPQASDFEREAWLALCKIPFGEVRSYGEQAKMLGKPGAARAVGRANARNPIPIVVPCHRIIGSDGSLTGFAGGLARKRWLLTHESVVAGQLHDPTALPAPANQLTLQLGQGF